MEDRLAEEAAAVRDAVDAESILALNNDGARFVFRETPHREIDVEIIFPERFPEVNAVPHIRSKTLAPALIKKLQEQAEAVIAAETAGRQASAVACLFRDMVRQNSLLFAWPEVRTLRKMVKSLPGSSIKVNERTGVVKLGLVSGEYRATVNLHVANAYPLEPLDVQIVRTNFPPGISRPFEAQAREIARRCSLGSDPSNAIRSSNPVRAPRRVRSDADDVGHSAVSAEMVRDLRHDMEFLRHTKELRTVQNTTKKGNATEFAASARERKRARQQLRRVTREEEAKEEKRLQQEEARRAAEEGWTAEHASAVPSLAVVGQFLADRFVMFLTNDTCPLSGERLLPADPAEAARRVDDEQNPLHPIRVYCGHWFHFKALNKYMTRPPFGKECPRCGAPIYHPRWPRDRSKLERAWALKEARKREFREVEDAFDLSDEDAASDHSGVGDDGD